MNIITIIKFGIRQFLRLKWRNVTPESFGARPNTGIDASQAIQDAIEFAHESGSNFITCRGMLTISKGIYINHSGMTLQGLWLNGVAGMKDAAIDIDLEDEDQE